jgi:hypothetical protein
MVGAAAALALLGILPFSGGGADMTVEQVRLGEWRLVVSHDRFNGAVVCEIHKPSMTYRRGLLVFEFDHHEDTANAEFRVQNGPARPIVAVATEAAGLGAQFGSDNLRNPSNGVVNIPLAALGGASHVAIRPNIGAKPRSFDLTGLDQAIVAAHGRGCAPVDQRPGS